MVSGLIGDSETWSFKETETITVRSVYRENRRQGYLWVLHIYEKPNGRKITE